MRNALGEVSLAKRFLLYHWALHLDVSWHLILLRYLGRRAQLCDLCARSSKLENGQHSPAVAVPHDVPTYHRRCLENHVQESYCSHFSDGLLSMRKTDQGRTQLTQTGELQHLLHHKLRALTHIDLGGTDIFHDRTSHVSGIERSSCREVSTAGVCAARETMVGAGALPC